jgi:hypothetical protein
MTGAGNPVNRVDLSLCPGSEPRHLLRPLMQCEGGYGAASAVHGHDLQVTTEHENTTEPRYHAPGVPA